MNTAAVRVFALMFAVLSLPAWAQADDRAALANERQALTARYAAEEQACRERFVVTACVDDVRIRRRAALAPLQHREQALDDAERLQRAAQRLSARAERLPPAPPASAVPAGAASAVAPRVPAPVTTSKDPSPSRSKEASGARAQLAAERARAAARRTEALEAVQAEVARKTAERAAGGKKAAPLPTPTASAVQR